MLIQNFDLTSKLVLDSIVFLLFLANLPDEGAEVLKQRRLGGGTVRCDRSTVSEQRFADETRHMEHILSVFDFLLNELFQGT